VLTQSNAFKLTGALGRQPTDGELYIAHFMGVGAASRLISNAENNPRASGAALFPAAAAANRSIFYNRDGAARSVSDVYSVLTSRYASAANSALTRTAMASAGTPVSDSPPVPASSAAYLTSFPQTPAPVAQVASVPSDNAPMFRSLFQAGDRPEPVSPMVRELWGDRSAAAPSSGGLDLFSDRNGTFSG